MLSKNNANFIVLLFLFFGWGFVTCLNDLLTPIFKHMFVLNQFQANFVSFAFFIAYFIGSLLYILCSMFGISFFYKLGYKGLILFGLALSALGCLIFTIAALLGSYPLFLSGLFSIGFGFTFLQISANPLVIISGDKKTAASRLNLAGGFNSLATALAPIVGVLVFYTLLQVNEYHERLKYPYIFLFLFFAIVIFLIWKFLQTKEDHVFNAQSAKPYALNHANLLFGMLAIFFYVGSEVSIGSNLIAYLKSDATVSLAEDIAGKYLAIYWGGAMIGRFLGGIALSNISKGYKTSLMVFISILLTCLILYTAGISNINITYYIGFIVISITLFTFSIDARTNLVLFSIVNVINLAITATIHNSYFALWAILSVGLFNSVMWPNIFTLALDGLGEYREQASSFLVMMILGGAILPIIQGRIADNLNIVTSFIVPLMGYLYILCYGLFYSKKHLNVIR
ncbi:MAG: hypothetical protein K0R14_1869 [Burkholderiales bacterium]|nr:hypothetical protein [Burkholderiales bacterium]